MPTTIEENAKYPKLRNFKSKITRCLTLLETKANTHRRWMDGYNLKIRAYSKSGANFGNGTIDIGLATFNASDEWLASVIVHEAIHFWQYRAGHYKAGSVAELEANRYQMDVLKKVGGSKTEIAHLASQNGKHGDLNGDGVYDEKDYKKRDW